MPATDDQLACLVLREYDLDLASLHVESHHRHQGFSGARLWRCLPPGVCYGLRVWPPGMDVDRLSWVHRLMKTAREDGLDFVPEVFATRTGVTCFIHENRVWDLTTWMPGRADGSGPSPRAHVEAACAGLARVHQSWHRLGVECGPCPAIDRRLRTWQQWRELLAAGWRPSCVVENHPPLTRQARRAWDLLGLWMPRVPGWLAPFRTLEFALQPCLCDVWQEHLLFTGDRLTGLIDYGAVKIDQVAVDLARLLGSAVGDDESNRATGREAYRRVRPLPEQEEALAYALDLSGAVLGMSNWL